MCPCQKGRGGQRSIIEVTTDEAVGVALALGRQVYVDEDIWEGGRVSQAYGYLLHFLPCARLSERSEVA